MPNDVTVRLAGVEQVYAKLGRLEGNKVLRVPTEQGVLVLQRDMKVYPPPRPRQRYRRTGTLGRRWTKRVRSSSDGVVGVVGNNTTYAPWVQSSRFIAWMHKDRWQTDEQVMEQHRPRIVEFFHSAIRRALRG